MAAKKLGRQTMALEHPPVIAGHANVAGKKEGEGPLGCSFDAVCGDDTFGEATWERAESAMQRQALAAIAADAKLSAALSAYQRNQHIDHGHQDRTEDPCLHRILRDLSRLLHAKPTDHFDHHDPECKGRQCVHGIISFQKAGK